MDPDASSLTPLPDPAPVDSVSARRTLDLVFAALEGHAGPAAAQALIALSEEEGGPRFDRVQVFEWDARGEELRPFDSGATGRTTILLPERLSGAPADAWLDGRAAVAAPASDESPWRDAAEVGAIALEIAGRRVGLLVGEWNDRAPGARRREFLERFARDAGALLAAVDRAALERRRTRHARALAEFTRASVSALNLAEALHLVARLAAESSGSRGSAVWRVAGGTPRLEVTFGIAGERERLARGLQSLAAMCVARGAPIVCERPANECLIPAEVAAHVSNVVALPVRAYGRDLGVFALYDRAPRGAFESGAYDELEMASLATLGDLLALVLDQAERFEELKKHELRGRELQARVAREERLASLGEMAARVARDARNPLASIGAFARRVHRELPEDTPHREYLEIVIRETERLERLVGAPLETLPAEPMRLRMESLNDVVQEALRMAGETLVRRRVRLLKKLSPELPPLLLDPDRIRIAVSNVLKQALEAVPVGGRIRVESRRVNGFAIVEVAHDGPRDPGDILEQVFVPFSSSPAGGSATLGLAMAQQVIQSHGGEIRARGEAEWTAVVSLTLPIQGNEDRRATHAERRQSRADRRRRGPER